MEIKNTNLINHCNALLNMVNSFNVALNSLSDNMDENNAIMKTLNVILESVRSQTVIVQNDIDNYEA